MTEIPITEGAAREAIRLGYEMAERLAAAERTVRRQRAIMYRAIMLLRSGRAKMAEDLINLELKREGEQ
jgi:hypothetical protein